MNYNPDRWVLLKLSTEKETLYKVMAGWYGGFMDSDEWKLNSGVTKVEETSRHYIFHGHTGSTYTCHKASRALTGLMGSVLANWQVQLKDTPNTIEITDEDPTTIRYTP